MRLGSRPAAPPIRTGWDDVDPSGAATVLDDLGDVTAPPGALGALVRTGVGLPAEFRALAHHHDQTVPVDRWLIAHGLPFTPSGMQIVGDQGQRIFPRDVVHTPGQTRIEFAYPVAGTADLS